MNAASNWSTGRAPISGGYLVWHRTGGPKAPLVLVHGLTDNGLCWTRLALNMAERFDVVMLDARGHDASARMPAGEAPDPAQDLAEAVTALGLTQPVMIGHSVGARAVARFAAAMPGCAALVVLEDPPLLSPATASELKSRREQFQAHLADLQAKTEEELVVLCRSQSPSWHELDLPAWAQAKHQVDPRAVPQFSTPWQDDLAAIEVPTLLISGKAALGSMVGSAEEATAKALNPRIETVRIARAGHNIRRENFADYRAVVNRFLRTDILMQNDNYQAGED